MNLKIYIGKKPAPEKDYGKILSSLADQAILQHNGGFIFKAAVSHENVQLGLLPSFSMGVRNMHYDIRLGNENGCIFTGFFNTDGSVCIIPLPGKSDLKTLHAAYADLLGTLLANGLNSRTPLDNISMSIIGELVPAKTDRLSCGESHILLKELS
ncbi:MAG: hypothetical protein JW874_11450 [Spirochaetales bacterium]|nr:hypothetical protein [Spirochaetales bacterium]